MNYQSGKISSLKRRFQRLTAKLRIDCTFHDLRRTFASLKVSPEVSIYKVAKWAGHRVEVCEGHYGHLIPCDDEIEIGIERRTPAPEVEPLAEAPHRQLTWEELRELVWSMPMTKAARDVGITDNGLRKWRTRCKVPLPPQGYWNLPPNRRPAPAMAASCLSRPPIRPSKKTLAVLLRSGERPLYES
jgi:hypothetical protein